MLEEIAEGMEEADAIVEPYISEIELPVEISDRQFLYLGMAASVIGDTYTTHLKLQRDGVEAERNPIMRELMKEVGTLEAMLISKIILNVALPLFVYKVLTKYNAYSIRRAYMMFFGTWYSIVAFGNAVELQFGIDEKLGL